MADRVCQGCGSTNVGAVVNDFFYIGRDDTHEYIAVSEGCYCKECGNRWEAEQYEKRELPRGYEDW